MKKLCIIMSVFCVSIIKADFTHVNLWQKDLATGEKQYVLCCGDRHRIMQKGLEQVERIMEFIAKVPGKNEIIIEDALNYQISMQELKKNDDGSIKHERLMEDFQDFQNEMNAYRRQDVVDGVISGIALVPEIAKECAITCTNIEFRQIITCQLPDLIELIDEHGFSHCHMISSMIETVLNTIASFDDSLQLNVFYKKILDNFMPIKKEIDAFIQTGRPMNEFPEYLCNRVIEDPQLIDLNNLSYSSPHPELKAMAQKLSDLQKALLEDKQAVDKDYLLKQIRMNFVFNTFSSLIDTYMLHQLYQKQLVADESNLICICAGLGHVYNIEQILPELGYELIVAQQDNNNAVDIDIDILMPSHPVQGLLNHFYRLCGQCATLLGF